MPLDTQKLLDLANQFEKQAIDIKQPASFDEDYKKYKEMLDPTPADDEGAYEKWLKDTSSFEDTDIPLEEDPVAKITRMNRESDERAAESLQDIKETDLSLTPVLKDEELGADTYIRTATHFETLALQLLAKSKQKRFSK